MIHNTRGGPSVLGLPHGRNPATSETLQYDAQELEFLQAVDRYKREMHRPFLTCVEILDIARQLGWRKVEPPGPLPTHRDG